MDDTRPYCRRCGEPAAPPPEQRAVGPPYDAPGAFSIATVLDSYTRLADENERQRLELGAVKTELHRSNATIRKLQLRLTDRVAARIERPAARSGRTTASDEADAAAEADLQARRADVAESKDRLRQDEIRRRERGLAQLQKVIETIDEKIAASPRRRRYAAAAAVSPSGLLGSP
jgi:hypothetical protein